MRYLGMWHALTLHAAGVLRRRVACARSAHRSWFATITGALFFLAVPAVDLSRLARRAVCALESRLWALYLYLRAADRARVGSRSSRSAR